MSDSEFVEALQYALPIGDADRLRELFARYHAALEEIGRQQQETLAMIEQNGFVFTSIGKEPGNWQHLAFSIYTDLCRVDTLAHQALDDGVLA